jgi:DNA modification methylase
MNYVEGTPLDLWFGPFKANRCYFVDCLDGMAQIPGKPFGFTITDPFYNVDVGKYKGTHQRFIQDVGHFNKEAVKYNDVMPQAEYEQFSRRWFEMAMRLSEVLVFTPGNKNLHMWYDIKEPKEKMIHYKHNCISFKHGCRFTKYEDILAYGELQNFHFRSDVFDVPLNDFFLQKNNIKGSTPKEIELWRQIIKRGVKRVKQKVIFDPMAGSGPTVQIAEELGLPWLAFEINPENADDIRTRVRLGMRPKNNLDGLR